MQLKPGIDSSTAGMAAYARSLVCSASRSASDDGPFVPLTAVVCFFKHNGAALVAATEIDLCLWLAALQPALMASIRQMTAALLTCNDVCRSQTLYLLIMATSCWCPPGLVWR